MTVKRDVVRRHSTVLHSPLRGWVLPLDDVPDPVFAKRMLGDGLAIDPVGEILVSPCDATITNIHAARHALTLGTPNGEEILVHLGLDSVALGGECISLLVKAGDVVEKGQPLLHFDLDKLVLGATAAITPIIVSGTDGIGIEAVATGLVEQGAPLFRIISKAEAVEARKDEGTAVRRLVHVALPHGIHARPAARLADIARQFPIDASVEIGGRRASASSALAVLGLGVKEGQSVTIEAKGENVVAALDALEALLADPKTGAGPQAGQVSASSLPLDHHGNGLRGIPAAPGIAIGTAFRFRSEQLAPDREGPAEGPEGERDRFERALAQACSTLESDADAAPGSASEILLAQRAFLEDPGLLTLARAGISEGKGAAASWSDAIRSSIETLLSSGDQRIAERIADLRDLEVRLLSCLGGGTAKRVELPPGSVIIANELLPSQVAALDPERVKGIALMEGGPTSHAAILAAGKRIPMAVAFGTVLDPIEDGTRVLLDADRGSLEIAPSNRRIKEARAFEKRQEEDRTAPLGALCHSADGVRIEVFANLGSLDDASGAISEGAEGCGLLRTEFLFLDRTTQPSEEEQKEQYQKIADALGEKPFIVRLLDVGSDKPASYISLEEEENPALGLRGIRVGLRQPGILETQIRAILSVTPAGRCRIMPPMVTDVAELDAVARLVERVSKDLGLNRAVELGVMVETPAAALIAAQLGQRAAFLSIGSNDLTQYALAIDRGNAALAADFDGLHPAVLKLIAATCEGARANSIPAGVCGGLAGDRLAIPILLGLGVTELSLPPARILATKAEIASLVLEDCRELAKELVKLDSAAAVRGRAARFLDGRSS